ncbi:glycerophosphodiester phosphodiesterase family protein [Amnibacterium sp. CER49]|uniref:glycerophosphodiester phosphodiesterase family protein n=1 Tax=Amnibacterium sp. CER49 TaxID=3039161 RepID=UPI002447E851|nr:glycerophosphodiester phosphodiesterase family protein [Amnibacterium sp. CER49]MDH2444000.1 glycerophosphodiester phosphodiesterase family protein [Amnibacterium sp. CER49]
MTRPLVLGHRGACGYLPELTSPALELALAQGADGVEVDVVASRDGVPVVRHERELSASTDIAARPEFADRRREGLLDGVPAVGWFAEDFDWAELATLRARERMPALRPRSAAHDGESAVLRLADVAALVAKAGSLLVVELKEPAFSAALGLPLPELVLGELAGVPASPRIVVESFEKSALADLAARGVAWPLVYLLDDHGAAADEHGPVRRTYADELADLRPLTAFRGVSVPIPLVTDALVRRAHEAGLEVWTWTLRPENRFLPHRYRRGTDAVATGDWRSAWTALLSTGVDAVFADHPDLAVRARSHVRERP